MNDLQLPSSKPFDPALPVVVLVHGALNDHSVWDAQARALLAAGHPVQAPDLPGHARIHGKALPSVEAMADWLLALLDDKGVQRAILVGHSMGSLVALQAASRAPQRVAGLALIGTAFPMKVADALLDTALRDEAAAIEIVTRWSHSPAGQHLAEATRGLMRRLAAANPGHLLHTDLAACNAYADGETAAAAVRCPTLLVAGSQDKMTPPRASAGLAALIAQADVVSVEAGHALMAEAPEAVDAALLRLAALVSGPRTGAEVAS